MSWIISVVTTICLLAASSVRADDRHRDPDAPRLKQGVELPMAQVASRQDGPSHGLRMSAFVVPAVARPDARRPIAWDGAECAPPTYARVRIARIASRGPPRA